MPASDLLSITTFSEARQAFQRLRELRQEEGVIFAALGCFLRRIEATGDPLSVLTPMGGVSRWKIEDFAWQPLDSPQIAHEAMEAGPTKLGAIDRLRVAMRANWPRVSSAWWTLVARPLADFHTRQ